MAWEKAMAENRDSKWIMDAVDIRKRTKTTMNRDEGGLSALTHLEQHPPAEGEQQEVESPVKV